MAITAQDVTDYIASTFDNIYIQTMPETGNTFVFYDPDLKFTFATVVTNDEYDQFSDLDRPDVYRVNMGITKQTFQSFFGPKPKEGDEVPTYDYTAINQLMPHPVYGMMYWVSIINPDDTNFENVVKPLLKEAYDADVQQYAAKKARYTQESAS